MAWVKSSAKVTPNGEILMPGEIEERTKAQRLRDGIDIDDTTWSQIQETVKAVGVGELLKGFGGEVTATAIN